MDSNRVNVVGWYNKKNCGDESYKEAFPKLFPQYDFVFSDCIVKDADAYVIGGGDVLTKKLLQSFAKVDKPKHIMSVTVSEDFDPELLKGYRTIIVRDKNSRERLEKIGIDVLMYPDFSFCLDYNKERGHALVQELFAANKHDLYHKKIGIVINGHLLPPYGASAFEQSRFERFAFDLAIAIDQIPASFVFIPFSTKQPWDDRISNGIVASRCKWWRKNAIFFSELGVTNTLDILSSCDAVISTRLHSSIFSTATEVPFVDITHNHKNKYFLETIGYQKNSIGFADFNSTKMVSLTKGLISDTNNSEEIGSIASMNKFLLNELKKNMLIT